ncbi:hypothetical protein F8388_002220 [Cannabis sativa]|uniref:RNase H type-1 domain-containing protein n=1 Tax=Cannabis sativa TaxID=3483 RepID=A0A7J6FNI3_CANSA|nr:hypothetical protein G4B88_009285 [Cannabis sativa]KAF4374322.1 hypothetical protein F8388_002220 [Cannabis sativa]
MLKTPETMDRTDITMEDLLSRTSNLTVLDEDGWEINNEGGTEVNSLCAMGRWVSNRPMSRSLLRTIRGRVWGISEKEWNVEIKFTSKEASFLVFTFKSSQDLNRIVIKNPWFLTNGTLILERLDGIPQIWENSLTKFPLSGRIFNLPPRSITKGNLERLAGFVGDVIEKIHSPYATMPTDGGKISGHSSAPINGLGKEILVTSPGFSCNSEIGMLNKGKQKISNGNLGLDFDMEKPIAEGECSGKGINLIMVQEGHEKSKRNGSSREEGTINLLNDPKIASNLAPSYGQRNPTETISTISMNLTEVPINYDCNLEILKKTEGPSKRRKLGQQQQLPLLVHNKPTVSWQPPPSDFHLINTDASLKLGHLGCGLSAIIRNPAGDLVVAEVKYIHGCMTVPMAEAAAIHLGVQLAVRWSINKAWVGSDCITLIQAAANNSFPPTDWGQLMKDIINGKNHFKELNFIFYPRVCNKVANSLARWSLMTQKSITMTKMLPSCAAALLIADVPSVAYLHCRCTNSSTDCNGSSLEWDWNRWSRHFSETEQTESFASVLKGLGEREKFGADTEAERYIRRKRKEKAFSD